MYSDIEALLVLPSTSIHDAVARLDAGRLGVVLIVDDGRRLLGTRTDGDIRRAVLAHVDLNLPIQTILDRKAGTAYATPIVASEGTSRAGLATLLRKHSILHVPIVDGAGHVTGLAAAEEYIQETEPPIKAVIMAGGYGKRLSPLTAETPKPLLAVGDRPLIESIIGRLKDAGIQQIRISTHYKPEAFRSHLGDGSGMGVELDYLVENEPLGTAGALGLMPKPSDTTLVINGDILTDVDFRAMMRYHKEHAAAMTVAVKKVDIEIPYGVVECDGPFVSRLTEKPEKTFFVNAGIYLIEPEVYGLIPSGQRLDMTALIQRVLDSGRKIASFPIREYWLDVGRHTDYEKAQEYANKTAL